MFYRTVFFGMCFLSNIFTVKAQTLVKGTVKDSLNNAIPLVNIFITPKSDTNNILSYVYSDTQGKYAINIDKTGPFVLHVSAMSFKKEVFPFQIDSISPQKTILKNIILKETPFELEEVIIQSENPIQIKKDTITFKASSFLKGNEQVVEDLLKNIPGLNVSPEGDIKIGNQEIEKLMVDGDDFFERGYKILSKNMPSDPIEKVEILKKYSNNKLLKGIENSDKIALNLVLKEDAKRVWFGNTTLGYGLGAENRYSVQGNLMNFGKKNKYYFLTNLNNIGADATGDIWHLIKPFRFNEPASIGDNQSVHTLLNLSTYTPNFKASRTNFNNAELLSLNAIFNPNKKLKIKTLGFFNWDENDFFRNSIDIIKTNSTSFTNTEDFTLRKRNFVGFGKLDFLYDISKTKTIAAITKYNRQHLNSSSNLIFNSNATIESLDNKNTLFDQKIAYTHKVTPKKAFLLTSRYIAEKTPQTYTINQFFYEDLFSGTVTDAVNQLSENKIQFVGLEAHWLDRKKDGDLVEIQLGNEFRKDELTTSFLLKENNIIIESPTNYQNNTNYITNDIYVKAKYRLKFKKVAFIGRLEAHQLFNQLQHKNEQQSPFFVNPKIGLNWEINKANKITSSYAYATTNATILDVYNNYVLQGFRSFSKGTGTFNQLDKETLTFHYQLGDWGSKFFANTFISYTKNHDFFSSEAILTQNYSQSSKKLFKDREMLTAFTEIDRYFKVISSNLKINLGYSKSNYKNEVNTILRDITVHNYNYGFELRSGFRGIFNYHFGTKWATNKVETAFNTIFTNRTSFLDFSFVFNDTFNVDIQTEEYVFGSVNSENNAYYFADFTANYTLKKNKIILSLSGKNLFNTKNFTENTVSDLGTSTTQYQLLPRYVLFKVQYRF